MQVYNRNELFLVSDCMVTPFDVSGWHAVRLLAISKVLYDDRTSDVTVVQPNEDAVSISCSMHRS